MEEVDKEISEMKLSLNARARVVAESYLAAVRPCPVQRKQLSDSLSCSSTHECKLHGTVRSSECRVTDTTGPDVGTPGGTRSHGWCMCSLCNLLRNADRCIVRKCEYSEETESKTGSVSSGTIAMNESDAPRLQSECRMVL